MPVPEGGESATPQSGPVAVIAPSQVRVSAEILRRHFNPPPSLRTVREWQKQGAIPFIKIGRKVYFNPPDVFAHLEKRRFA
jgi:hypothetical protein